MYERFTNYARKAMALANQETQRLGSVHLGTEHVLLGILAMSEGVAFVALGALGVNLQNLRSALESAARARARDLTLNALPIQPDSNLAVRAALQASSDLGHNYVGTEHLLLGLLRVQDCPAALALNQHGITYQRAEETIVTFLTGKPPTSTAGPHGRQGEHADIAPSLAALRMEIEAMAHRFDVAMSTGDTQELERLRELFESLLRRIRDRTV